MPFIRIWVSDEWLSLVDAECVRRGWRRNAGVVNLVWDALSIKGVLSAEDAVGVRDGSGAWPAVVDFL